MSRNQSIVLLAAVLPTAACGVFGLSSEERDKLALFKRNAKYYFEGGHFSQALDAVRRGLEIRPDDYNLQSIAATCYLRTSDGNRQNLRKAELLFDHVYQMRSPSSHQPYLLLWRSICHQKLGNLNHRRAEALREEIARRDLSVAESALRTSRAQEHEAKADYHWSTAIRGFEALLQREEQLRLAHKHLMEIHVEQGDYHGAVEHARAFLARTSVEQENRRAIIRVSSSLRDENNARAELRQLVDQEMRVRSSLAEMHYRQGEFALSIEQLDKLLELDPNRAVDYYNRARAHEMLGQDERARRDYEKFLGATKLPVGSEKVRHAVQFTQRG